jgi:hypothetical protein
MERFPTTGSSWSWVRKGSALELRGRGRIVGSALPASGIVPRPVPPGPPFALRPLTAGRIPLLLLRLHRMLHPHADHVEESRYRPIV